MTGIKISNYFSPKSRFSAKFTQNSVFPKILFKIDIFEDFDQNRDIQNFSPISIVCKYWPNEDFRKFRETSNLFLNFDQNIDFLKIWAKPSIFENFELCRDFR